MTNRVPRGLRQRVAHVHAVTRLVAAIGAGAVTASILPARVSIQVRAVASWDGFAVVALVLTWLTIVTLEPQQIRTMAQREDPSRLASLVLVVLGAVASLLAVLVLLQESMTMQSDARVQAVVLALSAVALAWALIHTVFTLRYAHLYYDAPLGSMPLEFPGMADLPDYLDLAYFAFVVGMTAQTSDVCVHDRGIRRTVLLHGVLAFAFNTSVVALLIGVLTAVLSTS